ncbi:hypothetical protein ScPMuIL_012887 [Solemya velum]
MSVIRIKNARKNESSYWLPSFPQHGQHVILTLIERYWCHIASTGLGPVSRGKFNQQGAALDAMGTFGGHALPGSFFILFSLWWTVQIFHRYFSSLKMGVRFTSSATFPCSCLCGRAAKWPIEAFLKIVLVTLGLSLEIYTGTHGSQFVALGNAQHATMFFFFGLTGIFDMLVYFKMPLPPDMDYVMMVLALMVEGLLFNFHLHGRTELDIVIHTLLVYAVVANIVAVLLEIRYRHSVLAALSRTLVLFVQGTWFWQVGFILYPPGQNVEHWDEHDHDQMMLAVMMFAWHLGVDLLIMLVIGGAISSFHRCYNKKGRESGIAMRQLIQTGSDGQTIVSLNDDESEVSDIEYQRPEMDS